ncbi:hypothetical protein VCRA2110O173_620001 [Vibrio crassostreae]|nr:hypothetical protein VCRA2110O173_620001 [Vibrio crassostreae]CAK3125421.1 hypothetical protein VCRA2127O302_560001 [Vibrio crassostreae]
MDRIRLLGFEFIYNSIITKLSEMVVSQSQTLIFHKFWIEKVTLACNIRPCDLYKHLYNSRAYF